MARTQTWTRNISKKIKHGAIHCTSRPIVNNEALEEFKRRAENLGLIVRVQPDRRDGKKGKK